MVQVTVKYNVEVYSKDGAEQREGQKGHVIVGCGCCREGCRRV